MIKISLLCKDIKPISQSWRRRLWWRRRVAKRRNRILKDCRRRPISWSIPKIRIKPWYFNCIKNGLIQASKRNNWRRRLRGWKSNVRKLISTSWMLGRLWLTKNWSLIKCKANWLRLILHSRICRLIIKKLDAKFSQVRSRFVNFNAY